MGRKFMSIKDQFRVCQEAAERSGAEVVAHYDDSASRLFRDAATVRGIFAAVGAGMTCEEIAKSSTPMTNSATNGSPWAVQPVNDDGSSGRLVGHRYGLGAEPNWSGDLDDATSSAATPLALSQLSTGGQALGEQQ